MEKKSMVALMKKAVAKILEIDDEDVDEHENLLSMGITSIDAMKIINLIKKDLNMDINPAVIFEYQTLHELSDNLLSEYKEHP